MSSTSHTWRTKRARIMDQVHARLAGRAKPAASIVSQPEPRTIGQFARGRQLAAGNYLFAGHIHELNDGTIWDVTSDDLGFAHGVHGFAWLDDLAAVGDVKSRKAASTWVFEWINRFGAGLGPGWTPDIAGRRLIRWISHAIFILRGATPEQSHAFYRSLGQQKIFLSRRWRTAHPGLPRFEALTGMIYAAIALEDTDELDPALKALEADCRAQVGANGGIPTRNPEELLEVFTLLSWITLILEENERAPGPEHTGAMQRIAVTLRALRHADGGLARFHGGGHGQDGLLDQSLATAGSRARPGQELYMGFGRLQASRTSVIMDMAPPPKGRASANAHASTLAFELTSGRCPLVVNCGSGGLFGDDWRRAGRATPSHSTLCLDGRSSTLLTDLQKIEGAPEELLQGGPTAVPWSITRRDNAMRLEAGHDGYVRAFGLMHARTLDLGFDGKLLSGEDFLTTLTPAAEATFDRALDDRALDGIPYAIRFHLHPDVDARLDMGGNAVSLALRSGDVWVFRPEKVKLGLEASVYIQKGRIKPRATSQIVLSGKVLSYASRIRWTLTKVQDSGGAAQEVLTDWDRQTAPTEDTND